MKRGRAAIGSPGSSPAKAASDPTMHTMSPNADGDGKNGKQRKLELGDKPVTVNFAHAPRIDAKTSIDGNMAPGDDAGAKVDELRRQCVEAHKENQQNLGLIDQRAKHVEDALG